MISVKEIKRIIENGNPEKLVRFFKHRKAEINRDLVTCLAAEPLSAFCNFILNKPEGRRRTEIYLERFAASFSGEIDAFLKDQKDIGYRRAMQGYHLNDVHGYTMAFKDALWRNIEEYNALSGQGPHRISNNEIFVLHKLLDYSFYLLSLSFIRTRDEIINCHQGKLQGLQRFAAQVVSVFEEERIWRHASHSIEAIFGLYGNFMVLDDGRTPSLDRQVEKTIGPPGAPGETSAIIEAMSLVPRLMALGPEGQHIDLDGQVEEERFKLVCVPIQDQNAALAGIILVHNAGEAFKFTRFDRNLISQMAYFTGAVWANSLMVSEIAEQRADLRNVTSRLISIQEAERKKIAADIHDVLTQALTGIGYKALFCIELADQDPDKLQKELHQLTEYINEALRQSRQIISDLRPHILDDIGIIAAFQKLGDEFGRAFGLTVHFSHPDELKIDPDRGIILFRILQEALHNIRRHAKATVTDITLSRGDDGSIRLSVKDNGRGFESPTRKPPKTGRGLGLPIMRERAEELGGTFQVHARPGTGCEVVVAIPGA